MKCVVDDFWDQILERSRKNDWATFDYPDCEKPIKVRKRLRRGFKDAGWKRDEIKFLINSSEDCAAKAPVTSPGVSKHAEAALARILAPIMDYIENKLPAEKARLKFAVEPMPGPFVSTINVFGTDGAIITVGSHFTRFCGLTARAFVRTLLLAPNNFGADFDGDRCRKLIRSRPDIILYWLKIYLSYALTGTNCLADFHPSRPHEALNVEQLALAMEMFAVVHEVGHVVGCHGRQMSSSEENFEQEYEADSFALNHTEKIESTKSYISTQGHSITNPYIWTGAGAVFVLCVLNQYRAVKNGIFDPLAAETHPEVDERIKRICNRNILRGGLHVSTMDFCMTAKNVVNCVSSEFLTIIDSAPFQEIRKMFPVDWEVASLGRSF